MIKRLTALFSIPSYALLFLCMLLQGMGISLSAPFLSIYFTDQLGVSVGMFGIFLSVTLIAGIWISTLIGRRSDLGLNRKNIYLVATLCNTLAYSGYLLIQDFTILFIYMTVFTALGAPGMAQLFAISREAVNKSNFTEHAFANSTLRSAFSLGFITGPLIGTLL
ncbi:MFS transporter [Paenibacillus antarcticus]|uniref:MFS transporter n=1 Tax=Paenibacillus antarcticus TaxID=253703 RepID=UPI000AB50FFC|nr:MFS transporter [Paenibacillus antarcticus]